MLRPDPPVFSGCEKKTAVAANLCKMLSNGNKRAIMLHYDARCTQDKAFPTVPQQAPATEPCKADIEMPPAEDRTCLRRHRQPDTYFRTGK